MKELKYFDKQVLIAGETRQFRFDIDPKRDLSFPNANGSKHLEIGDFFNLINNQKILFELVD